MQKRESNHEFNLDINVNKEQLDDTIDELKELNETRPNITIRNNENVYVTINYFNETEKQYTKLEAE